MNDLPPLALYIHIPWCIRKCPYCDFNSHEYVGGNKGPQLEKQYLQALLDDLDEELTLVVSSRTICSIFIGGGTPSLMTGDFYIELLEKIRQRISVNLNAEITIEANPGAVDEEHFAGFIRAGINRLSLGVQSFSNPALEALGRIHDASSAKNAFNVARSAGFNNINIDLMHGLPTQSLEDGLRDLETAFSLSPEHISWYQLTIEQNTAFYKRPPVLPLEDTLDMLFERGQQMLSAEKFEQYEVSAFAKSNYQAGHNKNYWQFGDYLGIGAGAHGKITVGKSEILRRWKTRVPGDYMSSDNKLAGSQRLDALEIPLEFAMNAFRLNEGFSVSLFEQRTGLSFNVIEHNILDLKQQGLVEKKRDIVMPTAKGRLFLNDIFSVFAD